MRVVLFCHSLRSDWNHGNAHFLRGICAELQRRGIEVRIFEPQDAWSARSLAADEGAHALGGYRDAYPTLTSVAYDSGTLDVDEAVDGADLVLVHEWNSHEVVARIGRARERGGRFMLLFHDTHHRSVTEADGVASYDLQHYDGVLAFGDAIRERYVANGWARRAWTWHEAADTHVFRPLAREKTGDLVWIGNWGDDERHTEIRRFLIEPVRDLRLRARVHGVRYPADALRALADAGIEYGGWLPNYRAPEVFGDFRATVHIPRRPYVELLPGIPTIRVFEALACGIPLVSCRWRDVEGLFRVGQDFLMVRTPGEMRTALRAVTSDPAFAAALARNGVETILNRHTCVHRVDELLNLYENHHLRPRDHFVLGQRPRDHVPRARESAGGART